MMDGQCTMPGHMPMINLYHTFRRIIPNFVPSSRNIMIDVHEMKRNMIITLLAVYVETRRMEFNR